MSKLRRMVCLMASVVFVGMTLGGCALFKTDIKYDNAQIVATVGSSISITKKELGDAFNSFGYQYVAQFSYTRQDAFNITLDTLVDREVAIRESVRLFGELSVDEKNKARNAAYEYVSNSFKSIEKNIRAQRGRPDNEKSTSETEDEKGTGVTYTLYEPVIKKGGSSTTGYTLNLDKFVKEFAPAERAQFSDGLDASGVMRSANWFFIESLKMPRGADDSSEKAIATETFNRMVRYLSNREQGVGQVFKGATHNGKWTFHNVKYNTEAEKRAVIEREVERARIEEEKSLLQKRLQECFNWGIRNVDAGTQLVTTWDLTGTAPVAVEVEMNAYQYLTNLLKTNDESEFERIVGENNKAYADSLALRAIDAFRNKLRVARLRYDLGYDKADGYGAKLLESLSSVSFVPRDIADKYFTVSHILVGFSDEQKAEIESINARFKEGGITETDRNNLIATVRAETTGTQYDEKGVAIRDMQVDDIFDYVYEKVDCQSDTAKRQRAFRDMIYMFNTDPGMQNPEFEYVIGIDTREKAEDRAKDFGEGETDTMSKMVPAFTRASRELYDWDYDNVNGGGAQGTRGTIWKSTTDDIVAGKKIDSGLVWTEYGAHIIMYTRKISDFIFTNSLDMVDLNLDYFLGQKLTSYGDKSFFDVALEGVTQSDYSAWEKSLLSNYKGNGKSGEITIYRWRYKDMVGE